MLEFFSNGPQLLIKGAKGLLVLIHLLVLDILTLPKPTDHSFSNDAPVSECLHAHQCLEAKTTISKRRKYKIEQSMRKTYLG